MRLIRSLIFFFSLFLIFYSPLFSLDKRFSDPDFSVPENVSNLVFNFFHHSCGGNLLNEGLASGLTGIGYRLHPQINNQYVNENNYTDYRHWYKRFQRELGIKKNNRYYRYEGPDSNNDPLTGPEISSNEFMLVWYEDRSTESMDIIMFKPCYPDSAVSAADTEYDGSTANNGYGHVTAGTPYSDDNENNYTYLNSSASVSAAYDTTYWDQGTWSSEASSLAQIKCAYRGMLNIFIQHPDILFIAMQGPPMKNLTPGQAANCRELARWFREDWLHQYDPSGKDAFQDYPLYNVVPFDFENSIARTANDPQLDKEYFWYPVHGFPDNMLDPDIWSRVPGEQQGSPGDDHPNTWLNQRTAVIFCGGWDTYSTNETHQPAQEYNIWINAVVNRWKNPPPADPGPEDRDYPDKEINCYPTLVDLNNTDQVTIVVPSLKNSSADISILTLHGMCIKKISSAQFINGNFIWTITSLDKGKLNSGTYIIKTEKYKTFLVLYK